MNESIIAVVEDSDKVLLQMIATAENADTIQTAKDAAKLLITLRYQLCKQLFQDLPAEFAKKIAESSVAAEENVSAMVYGEIEFSSFFNILQVVAPKLGDTIVDLGHGTGKALIASFILYGPMFSRIHGVDIVPELVEESRRRLDKLHQVAEDPSHLYYNFVNCCRSGRNLDEVITIEVGDLLSESLVFDWTTADIVFANSTCFGFALMDQLSEKAARMKPGSKLVTFTLPLRSAAFDMVLKRNYIMSWGIATVYFHIRKQEDS